MHSYAAFLGHQPQISIAELAATLPDFKPQHIFGSQMYVFSTAEELDQKFLDTLGGIVLIAKQIVGEKPFKPEEIPGVLQKELANAKGKVTFSIRTVGMQRSVVRELFRACKNALKQGGRPSRYIGNENEPAKPIQLHDEDILDPKHGCEIVMLQDKDHRWTGRTVAAQNVKAYTLRDMEKPVRDTRVGLLPPKLAQTLLNFGIYLAKEKNEKLKGKKPEITIFDPFCGTGVIPIECLLRGFHILASDVAIKAVQGTEKNVEWGRKTYKILKKDVDSTVWKQDATKPFELKTKPDVIVSEGTLGPAMKDRPTIREAESNMKDAEKLTASFLRNARATLPDTPVVMTWPVWYAQKRQIPLPKIAELLADIGYRMVLPPHVSPMLEDRFSLLYRRPDQFVGREIVLLMPK